MRAPIVDRRLAGTSTSSTAARGRDNRTQHGSVVTTESNRLDGLEEPLPEQSSYQGGQTHGLGVAHSSTDAILTVLPASALASSRAPPGRAQRRGHHDARRPVRQFRPLPPTWTGTPRREEPRTIDLDEHHRIRELVIARDAVGEGAQSRRHIGRTLTAAINALEDCEQAPESASAQHGSVRRMPHQSSSAIAALNSSRERICSFW